MKNICWFLLSILLVVGLTACADSDIGDQERTSAETDSTGHEMPTTETGELAGSQEPSKNNDEDRKEPGENENTESNVLIAYFSWAENAVQDDIDAMTSASVKLPGNVAQLASWIAEETGGDLFSIQVTEPYPAGWDECLSRANQEKTDSARPELIQNTVNMDNYEVIFLGYPNWWYSCPMALLSFIESNDFSGKKVYLFCSHGTGGLARSVEDISEVLQGGDISENVFDAYEDDTLDSRDDLDGWLKGEGF